MLTYQPLDALPILMVFLLTVGLLLLSIEAGYYLGKRIQKRWPDHSESGVGVMVGASLAFLGFMLAFITGVAVNIFIQRMQLVVTEANAIGTTYLRAGYLDEPYSSDSRRLLSEYVDWRLKALDRSQLETAITRSEQIHTQLWSIAETVARLSPVPTISLYISSLNEVIDLHAERVAMELRIRVPPTILLALYLVAILTMVLIGIHGSYSEKRNYLALIMMVLILAMVFILIIDLDRSQHGLLKIPHQPLLDLQKQIQQVR
jgi:hypothetical protein